NERPKRVDGTWFETRKADRALRHAAPERAGRLLRMAWHHAFGGDERPLPHAGLPVHRSEREECMSGRCRANESCAGHIQLKLAPQKTKKWLTSPRRDRQNWNERANGADFSG